MKDVKRVVSTSLWNDKTVLNEYSAEDKYFMLYLLVNPYTTQLGIYNFPVKHIALDMGYSVDTIYCLLDRFENKYKNIKYSKESGEIAIKNYLKHSIVKGGKPVLDCLKKETSKVADRTLIEYIYSALIKEDKEKLNATVVDYLNYLSTELKINSNKDNDKDNDNDNERIVYESSTNRQADVFHEQITEVIEYLNLVAEKNYKTTTDKNRKFVRARLNEGFSVEDCKSVVDKKCAEWKNNAEMNTYLRPETLFGTKFESYLNQNTKPDREQTASVEDKRQQYLDKWRNA